MTGDGGPVGMIVLAWPLIINIVKGNKLRAIQGDPNKDAIIVNELDQTESE